MTKILTVAKMVFKKRVLSPAYYWIDPLAPLALTGSHGAVLVHGQTNRSQSTNHRRDCVPHRP